MTNETWSLYKTIGAVVPALLSVKRVFGSDYSVAWGKVAIALETIFGHRSWFPQQPRKIFSDLVLGEAWEIPNSANNPSMERLQKEFLAPGNSWDGWTLARQGGPQNLGAGFLVEFPNHFWLRSIWNIFLNSINHLNHLKNAEDKTTSKKILTTQAFQVSQDIYKSLLMSIMKIIGYYF